MVKLTDKNTSDSTYRAFALDMLNLVVKDISNRQIGFHWRFLEKTATTSTVASQFYYGLPTDIDTHKIFHLSERDNDITYIYTDYHTFRKYVADQSESEGTSRYWTLWASQIGLYPVPSEVITVYLDYVSVITDLADDSATIEIPSIYDPVIINGALSWAYRFDPQLGAFASQEQLYLDGLSRMEKNNNMILSDPGRPESHRTKNKVRRGALEFPVDSTNI